ncbi:uncharacterized protein LOC131018589 [Salvia miltiorrhiza]|uniref:uncharacterized protein LOC131018589 n=1 Tax=Salvia miltiorrhiza TaxID=226208 RepID=UPI0025AB82F2|nr:uncharacterized protein LOC131018589 [Salvia miltiorrhiza]
MGFVTDTQILYADLLTGYLSHWELQERLVAIESVFEEDPIEARAEDEDEEKPMEDPIEARAEDEDEEEPMEDPVEARAEEDRESKVDTDEKMSELFCAGLRQDIRVVLASQAALSYTEALNRALDMELAMQPEKVLQAPAPPLTQTKISGGQQTVPPAQSGKRKWQGQGQQQQGKQQYLGQSSGQQMTPPCAKCNKMHLGVCKAGSNSCFHCGQAGHYLSHCPSK